MESEWVNCCLSEFNKSTCDLVVIWTGTLKTWSESFFGGRNFFDNSMHSMNLLHASRKGDLLINGEKYDIHSKCYDLLSWSNGGKPLPSFQDS